MAASRAFGPPPPSVEAAAILCFGSALVSGFLALIALLLLAPRETETGASVIDVATGLYLLALPGAAVVFAGISASRGGRLARWILPIVAITALSLAGSIPLLWIAVAGMTVATVMLWSPASRRYSRSA